MIIRCRGHGAKKWWEKLCIPRISCQSKGSMVAMVLMLKRIRRAPPSIKAMEAMQPA